MYFRIRKYGRLKEIPIKEEIDKKIYDTINNQLFMNTNNIANQNWTINAPAGVTYLGEINKETNKPWMTEIPTNCLFNKKQTGCGATELAIRNSIPTIIAMPYVALVKNKTIYRKDAISVLGVYEGIQE